MKELGRTDKGQRDGYQEGMGGRGGHVGQGFDFEQIWVRLTEVTLIDHDAPGNWSGNCMSRQRRVIAGAVKLLEADSVAATNPKRAEEIYKRILDSAASTSNGTSSTGERDQSLRGQEAAMIKLAELHRDQKQIEVIFDRQRRGTAIKSRRQCVHCTRKKRHGEKTECGDGMIYYNE
ncbi:hypothetical protein L210DRAFT_3683075 [Boletus edulis BED1]|uniref:26S proteasome regulatory subunit Rpn6 N-terminal domain-containing protein n=1 Tax=Boletus edulis BED1 TaxID=1328754 RepID=A0AAD4BCQ7_BOLED|nr:hypothetical protein L210DRAFT_3683075 [Boletus edulis BED1]